MSGVDALAQEIRRLDGDHKLGAGALAEALWPFISTLRSERWIDPFKASGIRAPDGADANRVARELAARVLEVLVIPASPGLDPITAYLHDEGGGRGRATIVCYAEAWTCFWGAMGGPLTEFIARCDAGYVAGNMTSGRRSKPHELAYARRVAQAVIDALIAQEEPHG